MSASQKIPESLVDEVVSRISQGWSLRRVAKWLTEEKDVLVTRSAVRGCLERAMQPVPDLIVDARRELAEAVPANIDELTLIQQETLELSRRFRNEQIPVAKYNSSLRELAQRSRLAIWMLRSVGIGPVTVRPIVQGESKAAGAKLTAPSFAEPEPVAPPEAPQPVIFLPEEVDYDMPYPPGSALAAGPPKVPIVDPKEDEPCPCGSFDLFRACHALLNAYHDGGLVTLADMDHGMGFFRQYWKELTPQHPLKDLSCPCGRPRLYLSCHGAMNTRVEDSDSGTVAGTDQNPEGQH